ncbi:MAG: membrane dipeptidase, partial [Anaerolineales bacterium]|nr:membrane dipeptidase [Anaerolineales bacterium]
DQVARLYAEVAITPELALCRTYDEILSARAAGQIALLLTMEGVEPLGADPDLLRVFYELGLRSLGLTHARRNAAADGALVAPSGSSPAGLTPFGREIVRQCEALGIILDLAHLNPAGFDEVLNLTSRPLIISHTNPRHFYDIERNSSDAQMRQVAERGGVIGLSTFFIAHSAAETTLDRYVEQLVYVADVAGWEAVGLGMDFVRFIYDTLSDEVKATLPPVYFMADLYEHSHLPALIARLEAQQISSTNIDKLLGGNFQRLFATCL